MTWGPEVATEMSATLPLGVSRYTGASASARLRPVPACGHAVLIEVFDIGEYAVLTKIVGVIVGANRPFAHPET